MVLQIATALLLNNGPRQNFKSDFYDAGEAEEFVSGPAHSIIGFMIKLKVCKF